MTVSRCGTPLALSILADLWLGDLTKEAQSHVEEHVLGCGACASRLEEIAALGAGVAALARRGLVRAIVTAGIVEAMEREGLHVRQYHQVPGGSVACTVTPADDVVVARLEGPFAGRDRVDLVFCDAAGVEAWRLPDVPVPAGGDAIWLIEPIDALRGLGTATLRIRAVEVVEEGDRLLGEYTFHHRPTAHP